MKRLCLVLLSCLSLQVSIAQTPVNDTCADALRLCAGAVFPIGKTTFNGTSEGYDSCSVESKSVWFHVDGYLKGYRRPAEYLRLTILPAC